MQQEKKIRAGRYNSPRSAFESNLPFMLKRIQPSKSSRYLGFVILIGRTDKGIKKDKKEEEEKHTS